MEEVQGAAAIVTFLESAPVKSAYSDCRIAADIRRDEAHWQAKKQAATLPTKSAQERELARLKAQREYEWERGAADCMVIAATYLVQINSAVMTKAPYPPSFRVVPEEVARTGADLSDSGLRDLQARLREQAASRSPELDSPSLHAVFYRSLISCWESEQLIVPGGDAKEVWKASCELFDRVSPRDGGQVAPTYAPPPQPVPDPPAANAQHQITPPSTQGPGARITRPDFPIASRWAGEAGVVVLKAYVLESGRVGEVQVERSSGFHKLDESAVREVQTNWRFVPGKQDGVPTPMWHTFSLTFRVNN